MGFGDYLSAGWDFLSDNSDTIGSVIGGVAGPLAGAYFGNEAADKQAEAIANAQGISQDAVLAAKDDIINAFNPAFADIIGGSQGAIDQLSTTNTNIADILSGFTEGATGALRSGASAAGNVIGSYGQKGIDALQQGGALGRADLLEGQRAALAASRGGTARGVQELAAFADTGETALQREAAFSGALGNAAQQKAYAEFSESPAQKFMRERQEQTLLRNQAATGGLGGGNVLTALQEQAYGIAAQQEQQYLQNLQSLATRGQQAATGQSNLQYAGGQAQAGINTSTAQALAQLGMNQGMAESGVYGNIGALQGQVQSNLGTNLAGTLERAGNVAVNAEQATGNNIANILGQTGMNMANLQTSMGTNLANAALGQAGTQANLATMYGLAQSAGTAGIGQNIGAGITNLADVISG